MADDVTAHLLGVLLVDSPPVLLVLAPENAQHHLLALEADLLHNPDVAVSGVTDRHLAVRDQAHGTLEVDEHALGGVGELVVVDSGGLAGDKLGDGAWNVVRYRVALGRARSVGVHVGRQPRQAVLGGDRLGLVRDELRVRSVQKVIMVVDELEGLVTLDARNLSPNLPGVAGIKDCGKEMEVSKLIGTILACISRGVNLRPMVG